MNILRAAFVASALVLALHAEESGIPPDPPDLSRPREHDAIVRVAWSAADGSGTIEMDHQKFAKPGDILAAVRTKVTADPELRVIFCPVGHVPLEFGKQVLAVLRQAGATRLTVAMPEGPVTLPMAKDAQATPPPGAELVVRVVWSATDDTGGIKIEDRKFAKADEILEFLQARAKAKPDLRILIRADRNVRYEYLKQVMVVAGKAGVGKVTFSVVDNSPNTP